MAKNKADKEQGGYGALQRGDALQSWAEDTARHFDNAADRCFLTDLRDDPDGLGARHIWRYHPPFGTSLRECCEALLRVLEYPDDEVMKVKEDNTMEIERTVKLKRPTMHSESAKRAVACKHWRVMPGMLDEMGDRVISLADHCGQLRYFTLDDVQYEGSRLEGGTDVAMFVPDFDDPATLGCLEHLVRKAWYGHTVDTEQYPSGWWNVVVNDIRASYVDALDFRSDTPGTLAEALVLALEAAP